MSMNPDPLDSGPATDADGFVANAFFRGTPEQIRKICSILGIEDRRHRMTTLGVYAHHKVTPELLRLAQEAFDETGE